MIIIADSREQFAYEFSQWPASVQRAGLPAGDYSILGFEDQVAVERKSLNDLVSCFMSKNRGRFERELSRLRSYELAVVVAEASMDDISKGRYRSEMKPASALQSIITFHVRHGTSFLFSSSRSGGEYTVYSLLSKYLYEIRKRYDIAQKHSMAEAESATG